MDLSSYLVEMLAKQGEVNVPGLGHFSNSRESATYRDDEARFYPPRSTVKYNQQYGTDNKFAEFLAGKKQISLASSRYFIDRYVDELLQEIAVNEAEITGLGWLRYDGSRISFRVIPVENTNPAYYGLPQIAVHKKEQTPATDHNIPDLSFTFAPVADTPAVTAEEADSQREPDFYAEEELEYEEKRGINIWLIVGIAAIVLGVAAVGIYFYKPSLLGIAEKRKPLVTTLPADSSVNQEAQLNDTLSAGPATPVSTDSTILEDNATTTTIIDETPPAVTAEAQEEAPQVINDGSRIHYEIQAAAYETQSKANKAVAIFKKRGIAAAHVVPVKDGRQHIISLGTFYTRGEAVEARKKLLDEGKIKESDGTYIEDYNPKQ